MRSWKVTPLALLLAACGGGSSSDGKDPQTFDATALFDPVPTLSTGSAIVPFPFDGLFAGFADPTLTIPNGPDDADVSFVTAANKLDGFSTVADAFFDMTGFVDFTSVRDHLLIVNGNTGAPLAYGTDFLIVPQNATAPDPLTHVETPVRTQRSRVLIEWLKPLAPSTTYVVALLKGVQTTSGGGVQPSPEFRIVSSATPVSEQHSTTLDQLDDTQKATLELLRSQLIRPVIEKLGAVGVGEDEIVLAYSFTTQSVGLSLKAVAATATAQPIAAFNTGVTTTTAIGVPGADVYAGTVKLPYYLANAGSPVNNHSLGPISTYWKADPSKPNIDPTDPAHKPAFLGQVPCAAFATGAVVNGQTLHASESTTLCYPVPVKQSDETVPMLVSVPNADSGATRPEGGWPVAIFQHGITGDRTQMLAIAATLAKAGFVTVAIDLPLHGLTNTASPFYRNQAFIGTPVSFLVTGERTFDLDLQSNTTGAPGPDGVIDGSGSWFINLPSVLTSRDNLRQAEADLISLSKSVVGLDLDHDGTPDTDGAKIRFVGLSLGSIVAIPFLASSTDVGAATVAVPGGGVGKVLDASVAFGPRIAAGLAAQGVQKGSDDYDTFVRFAQTVVDDGDPLNYAAAASAAHPIHLIQVVGGGTTPTGGTYPSDTVVPNSSLSTCPDPLPAGIASPEDLAAACAATPGQYVTIEPSYLGGTNPLVTAMGLQDLGAVDVPIETANIVIDPAGVRAVVRFREGTHGSLLDPTAVPAATQEMQRQTANFLGSNGICLPLGDNCPGAGASSEKVR